MASSLISQVNLILPVASTICKNVGTLESSRVNLSSSFSGVPLTATLRTKAVCQRRGASLRVVAAADTKAAFLKAYRKPIPSIYNNVIQELIVQQHLTRYNSRYKYDAIFALGFVTVWDQLMDGYGGPDEKERIFRAYVEALKESPEEYRSDAQKLEEWAGGLDAAALIDFGSRDGPVEGLLKEIAARAKVDESFHYSRFFAIGLFRLLELVKASEPATLEKLCAELGVNKKMVDRDLDVYRGLLNKLTQAKELLRDYLAREKVKQEEREKEKAQAKAE